MNASEFNKAVDEYADGIFRFILKNTRDEERARDIVQDTFEKLWLKVEEIDAGKVKSYLFTVAYHTMIDVIRRDKFTGSFDEVKESGHTIPNSFSDVKSVLNRALAKLSEIQRSVVLLRDYEGYSYEEIGRITGLNESQVKTYIYRARIFLKEYIGNPDIVI